MEHLKYPIGRFKKPANIDAGWTIRQVVHHVMDSHINAYIRFKWTLTEDNPTIKAYKEALWAELPDTQKTPITISLYLLSGIQKMVTRILYEQWSVCMLGMGSIIWNI